MLLHGKSLIKGRPLPPSHQVFTAFDPCKGAPLEPNFHEAQLLDVGTALDAAHAAFVAFRRTTSEERAVFLETIATEIIALGEELLERAHQETGLSADRLSAERGRTVGQLRLFAEVLREGSWCDARIDTALPERAPFPRADLRRMLVPIGPVVVFGASNFPLAYSVAGGDVASALAVGCPVVVKGHPAHPGTSELVAGAVIKAAQFCGLPPGVFALLQGRSFEIGTALVQHPKTRAVGFTGSHRGGRALFDAAAARSEPIPVFAEMGSLNPIFILPGALRDRGAQIVEGLKNSITAGAGQFCTKPGLIFGLVGTDLETFTADLKRAIRAVEPGSMLHPGIRDAYLAAANTALNVSGVSVLARSDVEADARFTQGPALLLGTSSDVFLAQPCLREEIFGPASLLVEASDRADLLKVAESLNGQLTATVHGTEAELAGAQELLLILERKAGRLIFNGFPTGVEVSPAMQHGGPYPATTDSRFTGVGTAAFLRWVRPVCYQNVPAAMLPSELRNENPVGLMRLINGTLGRSPV
jgi:NADP-dependent aldehyde dehydrogenase